MLMMRLMVGFHRGIRSTILVSVPARTKIIWPTIAMLMAIMLLFVGIRLATDIPNVALGRIPEDEYPRPYARHSIAAYLHIIPAAIYLLGAPFLPPRRSARAIGPCIPGWARPAHSRLISGVFAIMLAGLKNPFGGLA
jgi:hypothetical protein